MILVGFGDTVATMYTFPTSMMEDDCATEQPPATIFLPMVAGGLDTQGTARNLRSAQTVGKAFVLTAAPVATTSTLTTHDHVTGIMTGTLAHCPIVPGSVITQNYVLGYGYDEAGILYSDVGGKHVIGEIDYATGEFDLDEALDVIEYSYTTAGFTDPWLTLGTALDALRAATIALGETKLWGLMRDGSYRWAWAKCIDLDDSEKVGQINHCPISLKFYLKENIWYSETPHTGAMAGALTAMTNAGNIDVPVKVTLTAVGAPCTAFEFRNGDGVNRVAFAGSVAVGKSFVVDSKEHSAKNDGVGAYANLTLTGSGYWLYLPPGAGGLYRWSVTGGTPTATYEYCDAWVM